MRDIEYVQIPYSTWIRIDTYIYIYTYILTGKEDGSARV
jgi:hypothetical protein